MDENGDMVKKKDSGASGPWNKSGGAGTEKPGNYTLFHPQKDRDVTDRAQEYTLKEASFMLQSWTLVFLFECVRKHKLFVL